VLYRALRPLLFRLDPERAHALGLFAARRGGALLGRLLAGRPPPGKPRTVAGLRFPNVLGLAAGFDKNGVALPFWRALGFGHVEFGTVTPRPQPGNEKPRLFRFPAMRALGNRLGFPNEGAAAVAARLGKRKRKGDIVGINLGKNRETPLERAADDYVQALELTRSVADYWVVNVSSPNTPGLRTLQSRAWLGDLLGRVRDAAGAVPLFVKLSPDLSEPELVDAVEAFRGSGCAGIVATNTTLARPGGISFEGGLSGWPLQARSREVLVSLRRLLSPDVPLISVGGIDGPEEARLRLDAGATLLQVYSALVFEGPRLPSRILREGM
jgi:dihydroorotate dehydrogenase